MDAGKQELMLIVVWLVMKVVATAIVVFVVITPVGNMGARLIMNATLREAVSFNYHLTIAVLTAEQLQKEQTTFSVATT